MFGLPSGATNVGREVLLSVRLQVIRTKIIKIFCKASRVFIISARHEGTTLPYRSQQTAYRPYAYGRNDNHHGVAPGISCLPHSGPLQARPLPEENPIDRNRAADDS